MTLPLIDSQSESPAGDLLDWCLFYLISCKDKGNATQAGTAFSRPSFFAFFEPARYHENSLNRGSFSLTSSIYATITFNFLSRIVAVSMGFSTIAIHAGNEPDAATGAVSVPTSPKLL